MDANKKIDLEHPLCPNESKILANILQNHSLRFSIAASSSVPWIYLGQFWHTFKEDGSKYRLKFMLDRKELTLTLDDFRIIFHVPQATENNRDHFVHAPKFSEMVPFYINDLGFTLELRSPSNFKTTGLVQPWQTLCKMFPKCLTTRVTGYDQPPLQIMQMLHCFVNNIHVDYADLLWEGFHYPLKHPTTLIPYPRFTKLIMVKSIFNSGKHKDGVGMKIPSWMITDEMKLTENYRMYAEVFGVDVSTTQSLPIESTQRTHRTTSAPRTPNPDVVEGESSAQQKSTVIRLCIPPRRSTRLTPPTPVLNANEADDIILQDTIQLSIAEQKSRDELEAKQNVEKVKEHLAAEEIEKIVEGTKNVEENEVDSPTLRKDDNPNDPDTRLEPRSNKESPEVKITAVVQLVNVNEEEEESAEDDYELKRREKGKHVEESRHTPSPTTIRSPRIHSTLISSDTEKLQELTVNNSPPSSSTPLSFSPKSNLSPTNCLLSLFKLKTGRFKRYKSFFNELQGRYGYLFEHLKTKFMPRKKFHELAKHLQEIMEESLPKMGIIMERQQSQADMSKMIADAIQQDRENLRAEISSQINNAITNHIPSQVDASLQQDDLPIWLALKYKFKRFHVFDTSCRPFAVRPRDQGDPHDDAYPEGENSAKRYKMSEHETYVIGESSSGQVNESDPGPTTSVSQELVDEMSQMVDEAKLRKNDIVWKSRKEILVSPYPQKPTPVVQSCQRDPKPPTLSLVNQDLLYLKKGSSGPEKIVMSLHKFPAVIFPDDDIEERTSRWKQKEPEKPKEVTYSNSKIVQIIKTYWELGHEHKFITKIVARRANDSIVSITKSDYKNLNKNDIEDMYLLIVNSKVDDYAETGLLWSLSVFIRSTVIWERVHDFQLGVESYQQKVNLTAPTITFPGIEKHKKFSIVSEPVYDIIYKNSKKEKRVMRHQEVHKFCDATLKRVLEGLKSYNNDVKHGYVTPNVAYENVVSNRENVTDVDVKNALKAKDVLCVSCTKNVLIPCHDKCLGNYKLNVHSKVRRASFTTPRTLKSKFEDTTPVVSKTRFYVQTTQSKSLDTTPVVSKTKIAEVKSISAKNKISSAFKKIKVVQIVLWIVDSGCSKHMTSDRSLLKNFIDKFMGTVRFGNDHFAAITAMVILYKATSLFVMYILLKA
ncbi:hypothetical protein Tco_0458252 [Tanacetum coccineum]